MEKLDETLPAKNEVYNNLNVEDKTYSDYKHVRRVWEDFEMKKLGKYHDLYVESGKLILADAFGNFRSTYIEIYELDLDHFFFFSTWNFMTGKFKKTEVQLGLLADVNILLMIEVGIKGGIILADAFGNFRSTYIEIYELDLDHFFFQHLEFHDRQV